MRFGGISKAGPIRRVVCSTRGRPIVAVALFLGSLAVSVRRLHYLDHSGLFLLIGVKSPWWDGSSSRLRAYGTA